MKAKTKIAIIAAITAGILIPTSIVMFRAQNAEEHVTADPGTLPAPTIPGPSICEFGGPLELWLTRHTSYNYPKQTINTQTANGVTIISYTLVPFSNLPFNAPASCVVVVYETTYNGERVWTYGYKMASGWWLAYWFSMERDQTAINSMLEMSEG